MATLRALFSSKVIGTAAFAAAAAEVLACASSLAVAAAVLEDLPPLPPFVGLSAGAFSDLAPLFPPFLDPPSFLFPAFAAPPFDFFLEAELDSFWRGSGYIRSR